MNIDIIGREPAKRRHHLPIFQQTWWLETACKASPPAILSATLCGRIVGTLTYVTHRNKIGAKLGLSPFWSHLGGPVIALGLDGTEQREAIRQIARKLPKNVSFRFACDPNSDYANIIAEEFLAVGFTRDADPTYIHLPEDGDALDKMKARHRAHIRSARRIIDVADGDADAFIAFYEENLATRSHSPIEIARTLLVEGLLRGQARVFLASRAASNACAGGEIDAAVACVWDERRYYYWMSARRRPAGTDRCRPNGDAAKVLILAAMQHARELGLVFDADAPESAGHRALFQTILGFDRVENRIILHRSTRMTRVYNRFVPILKARIKAAFPAARIYDPRATLRE